MAKVSNVENNFTKGFVTEFTGLNFPENAATQADNCDFSLVGDVSRRLGINYETNFVNQVISASQRATNTYEWKNAGGDGVTKFVVTQVGDTVQFWRASSATTASPLSTQLMGSTVVLGSFVATGATFRSSIAAEFTDGNGYLFIFHPDCDPIYCTYFSGTGVITGTRISVQIRDFVGVIDSGIADNTRPNSLGFNHQYNLQNQGWTSGNAWSATSTSSVLVGTGAKVFTVAAGLSITAGQTVSVTGYISVSASPLSFMTGTVSSYVGTTLTLSISSFSGIATTLSQWTLVPISTGYVNTFFGAVGLFPSNADQWWRFKRTDGVFDPASTVVNTSIGLGAAPKGHYILNAFTQYRTTISGINGITDIVTTLRPTNGAWFQGRIWYTGVNASQTSSGVAKDMTWTETIYFSQIVEEVDDFGKCFQVNDPTSEELFDLLPTDGGTIFIQGSGPIYKLFPIQNGMIVFAGNGIWFITGNNGIGFSANDYTITKLSSVQSIGTSSYVDVQGLPYFWNEDGIYTVTPNKGGGLTVIPITFDTILSFYQEIPLSCKKAVRGTYNPLTYVIQWGYRDNEPTDTTQRFSFNRLMNFNTVSKAFFPYSVDSTTNHIAGLCYVSGIGGSTAPSPIIKYFVVTPTGVTFGEEWDPLYVDWRYFSSVNYESSFTTGYKVHGDGQRRFQIPYVYVYLRTNDEENGFKVQGVWDYATSGNTGRWSTAQIYNINESNYSVVPRRIRIRGQGLALQMKFKSVTGLPFDFIGWSIYETQNAGV